MTDVKVQLILFWIAVAFCFAGTLAFMASFVFRKKNLLKYGVFFSIFALIPMVGASGLRWLQTGHYPFVDAYELYTSAARDVLFFFLLVQLWKPTLKVAGTLVLPVSMALIGAGVMTSTEISKLPDNFLTVWVWIHIIFANLASGGVIIATALSVIYLVKSKQQMKGRVHPILASLPSLERIDYLNYRFLSFSFLMLGIMIISGSIWAYKSWGSYWNWDPIELWSLVSWLIFGFCLHLRIIGVKRKWAAWLTIVGFLVMIFTLAGIPVFYDTIHEYLKIS